MQGHEVFKELRFVKYGLVAVYGVSGTKDQLTL